MRHDYPDYTSMLRSMARTLGWSTLAFVAVLGVSWLSASMWVFAVGGLIILGAAMTAAGRDARARLREERRGEEPQAAASRRARRPAWSKLGFSVIVALGAPITIIGAAADQKVVLFIGLVLLGLFLLDLAVFWPLRSARRTKAPSE
jgi:hypothetical protein